MLKKLLEIWREDQDPLREMVSEFEEMIHKGNQMFRSVTDVLFLGGDIEKLKKEIYDTDAELNGLEQTIRRKIVVHLSLGHRDDLTPSLILMSIVKDAERIGDYAKNIYQVNEVVAPLNSGKYLSETQEIRNAILGYFDMVRACFVDSDVGAANDLLIEFYKHEKNIDSLVREGLKHQSEENMVSFVLLLRFFKRIISHLGNIVTSVVMPVDKLDYFDEDHRDQIKDLKTDT